MPCRQLEYKSETAQNGIRVFLPYYMFPAVLASQAHLQTWYALLKVTAKDNLSFFGFRVRINDAIDYSAYRLPTSSCMFFFICFCFVFKSEAYFSSSLRMCTRSLYCSRVRERPFHRASVPLPHKLFPTAAKRLDISLAGLHAYKEH